MKVLGLMRSVLSRAGLLVTLVVSLAAVGLVHAQQAQSGQAGGGEDAGLHVLPVRGNISMSGGGGGNLALSLRQKKCI